MLVVCCRQPGTRAYASRIAAKSAVDNSASDRFASVSIGSGFNPARFSFFAHHCDCIELTHRVGHVRQIVVDFLPKLFDVCRRVHDPGETLTLDLLRALRAGGHGRGDGVGGEQVHDQQEGDQAGRETT